MEARGTVERQEQAPLRGRLFRPDEPGALFDCDAPRQPFRRESAEYRASLSAGTVGGLV